MFRIRSNAVFVEMSIRESKAQATPSEPPAGPQHCYSPLPLHAGSAMILRQARATQLTTLHWAWRLNCLENQNISKRNVSFECFICRFFSTKHSKPPNPSQTKTNKKTPKRLHCVGFVVEGCVSDMELLSQRILEFHFKCVFSGARR